MTIYNYDVYKDGDLLDSGSFKDIQNLNLAQVAKICIESFSEDCDFRNQGQEMWIEITTEGSDDIIFESTFKFTIIRRLDIEFIDFGVEN